MEQAQITLVVTSCNRHDLLRRTLDSFVEFNTYPIKQTIVIEDGIAQEPEWFKSINGLGDKKWITNGKRKGQIFSVDRAYAEVNTEYIFHCEDDWEFSESGFIEKSLQVLKSHPEVIQVSLREDWAHPIIPSKFGVPICQPGWDKGWGGFAFNPGLRRLSDYRRIGSYGKHVGYDPRYCGELELSRLYLSLGYFIADIGPHCHHIGGKAHVAWETAPKPPRVLIAIPACHKYEYKDQSDDRIHKNQITNERVSAVRKTWAKYVEAFKSYVDLKFFYGQTDLRHPEADEVFLNVPDDYKGLPHKVKGIFQYALQNGYDYVFKGDDDTFIYVDRLMASDFEKYDYVGYVSNDSRLKEENRYASGGSGYWINRKAMQIVVNRSIPLEIWAEDAWVGKCLYESGIKVVRDARYLPGFWEHFTDLNALEKNHSYISFHACTPVMMDQLFNTTVNPNFKLVSKALHEDGNRNVGYLDEVVCAQDASKVVSEMGLDQAQIDNEYIKRINAGVLKLIIMVRKLESQVNHINQRIDVYNTKSSHKI